MDEYRVATAAYSGPLDLLLFLIKRSEVDIQDIPIAEITRQYVEYVEVLRQLDPETAGEFIVLAATLMEIKSRTLLPNPPEEEVEEDLSDPRLELVRQLLEYKRFKDASRELEHAAAERALKFARAPGEAPAPPDEWELDNLDIWDLVDAFKRILEQVGKTGPVHRVGVDDTPLALHAADILDSLQAAGGTQLFEAIFLGRSKAEKIGLFLALLELIRRKRLRISQERPFAAIYLHLLDATPVDLLNDVVDGQQAEPFIAEAAEDDREFVAEGPVSALATDVLDTNLDDVCEAVAGAFEGADNSQCASDVPPGDESRDGETGDSQARATSSEMTSLDSDALAPSKMEHA